jgi:hypothetical protein
MDLRSRPVAAGDAEYFDGYVLGKILTNRCARDICLPLKTAHAC